MRDQLLIRGEEEQLVFHDRAAHIASELIRLVRRPGLCEEVTGIQRVIAKVIERCAVERIGPGLDREVDDGAAERPILRVGIARLHLE